MKINRILIIVLALMTAPVLIIPVRVARMITGGTRPPVQVPEPAYWPTEGWEVSTPEEQGLDSAILVKMLKNLQDKQENIDSLLIIRNGYVVTEAYFEPYDGSFPHDLASVTKSVTTTLIAIAAEQGYLDLDQPMVSFFPDRQIANLDERKARMTVRHLVRMVNGMESGCHEGDAATLDKMRAASDWMQAALDRPMVAEPGTAFCYDSPGSHILSAILQEATGMTEAEFGKQYLFEPLGITDVLWEIDPQGYTRGWGDLHLRPRDLAKIAFLWLHRGNWNGQQLVSEAWVLDSVTAHSKSVGPDYGYGNGWWISTGDYYAVGRGGQRARVIASANTILVVTGGDYDEEQYQSYVPALLLQIQENRRANPKALAELGSIVAAVAQGEDDWTSSSIPDTAASISGKTYQCEDNPASLKTFQVSFEEPGWATAITNMNGQDRSLPIGLDGKLILGEDGTGYRGYWQDASTFQFEAFDIGLLRRQMKFEGNRVEITFPEANLTITCQASK